MRHCQIREISETNIDSYSEKDNWDTVNYLDTGNVTENNIQQIQFINLTKDKLPNRARRKVIDDDIIFSNVRPIQKHYGYIKNPPTNFLVSTGFTTIRANQSICYPKYLYYYLTQDKIINYLQTLAEQAVSTYPSIKSSDIEDLEIPLPPLSTQKKIASVLSSLDDKIELNTRMNKVLEDIAQALFKRWFVEFEFPNDEGKPYKSSGGKMVESEMGLIPEGWRVGTLGDITNVIDCLHSKKPERCKIGKQLLQLDNIRDDGLLDISYTYLISVSDYQKWISRCEASKGDCVITNVGRVGAVAQIPEGVNAALGRNMTCVRCKPDSYYPTFILEYLLSDTMRSEIVNKTDVGTILNALNVRNIPKLRIIIPDNNILFKFETKFRCTRYVMEKNLREIQTLSKIRNTLLPKLMNNNIYLE